MLQVNIKTNLVCEFIKTAYLNFPTSYPACQIRKDTLDQKKGSPLGCLKASENSLLTLRKISFVHLLFSVCTH